MIKKVQGIVRGKSIELAEELGVADGQAVEVRVRVVAPQPKLGEGLARCAGALADDPYWDAIMEEVYENRKLERRNQLDN